MTGTSIEVTIGEVAASLVLVGVAVAISRWRRAGLEVDIGIAVLRSFIQLTAIGFVITAIFDVDSLLLVVLLLATMVGFGAFTAGARARAVPKALVPLIIALSVSAVATDRPDPRARHLPGDAPLPGAGRRDGDRQRHDRLGRRAEPAGRRDA